MEENNLQLLKENFAPKVASRCIIGANLVGGLYLLGCLAIYLCRDRVITLYMYTSALSEVIKNARLSVSTLLECWVLIGLMLYALVLLIKDKKKRVNKNSVGNCIIITVSVFVISSIVRYPLFIYETQIVAIKGGSDAIAALSCMEAAIGRLGFLSLMSILLCIVGMGIWYGSLVASPMKD